MSKSKIEYVFLVENCFQYQSYVAKLEGDKVIDFFSYHRRVSTTDFFKNLIDREIDFRNKEIRIECFDTFYGWRISQKDYERARKLCELAKYVDEFEKLGEYK